MQSSSILRILVAAAALSPSLVLSQVLIIPASIQGAVGDMWETQRHFGNDAVRKQVDTCYKKVQPIGPSEKLEYCIAFDAANIEMTTRFYEAMAQKYKMPTDLQPEETKRSIGTRRIVDQATKAKVSNPIEYSQDIYNSAMVIITGQILVNEYRTAK